MGNPERHAQRAPRDGTQGGNRHPLPQRCRHGRVGDGCSALDFRLRLCVALPAAAPLQVFYLHPSLRCCCSCCCCSCRCRRPRLCRCRHSRCIRLLQGLTFPARGGCLPWFARRSRPLPRRRPSCRRLLSSRMGRPLGGVLPAPGRSPCYPGCPSLRLTLPLLLLLSRQRALLLLLLPQALSCAGRSGPSTPLGSWPSNGLLLFFVLPAAQLQRLCFGTAKLRHCGP